MSRNYVYAAHFEAPITVCRRAWLLPGERGEGGYDTGINFSGVDGLVTGLRENHIFARDVNRLVMVAHGAPGAFWIDHAPNAEMNDPLNRNLPEGGVSSYFSTAYGWTFQNLNDPAIATQLHRVGHYLHSRSELVLLGCNAGSGPDGDAFLTALSLVWRGVRVVGFPVIVAVIGGQSLRTSGACVPPGLAVTAATGTLGPRRIGDEEPTGYRHESSQAHPWGNASHPLAKIAQNGRIIHSPTAR